MCLDTCHSERVQLHKQDISSFYQQDDELFPNFHMIMRSYMNNQPLLIL